MENKNNYARRTVSAGIPYRFLQAGSVVLLALLVNGCSSLGVEPWERDILSAPDMQFSEPGAASALTQHFYFSKEAASGGQGFAGGGCGCN